MSLPANEVLHHVQLRHLLLAGGGGRVEVGLPFQGPQVNVGTRPPGHEVMQQEVGDGRLPVLDGEEDRSFRALVGLWNCSCSN